MSLDKDLARPVADPAADVKKITDLRTLRALAHPVRIALIEELVFGGPATATQLGERIGETPTTCSFHLRQLAKYGFVEEAGGGKGRSRPWRLTSIGFSIGSHDDPESEIAADALLRVFRERQLGRLEQWLQSKGSYPKRWRDEANNSEYIFYLTISELEQLNAQLADILVPLYRERLARPELRPAGAVPVELLLFNYPIRHPDATADDAGDEQ
jgi:DNA-binding transcriptional ArsR family regulator